MRIPDWRWILKWKVVYPIRHGHSYTSEYEVAVRQALTSLSGESFWDVGANTGYYTLMLAKNFDQVTALEPNPTAGEILKRKIAKNHLSNIRLIPVALSDVVGRSKLYLHTEVRGKTIGSSNTLITPSGGNSKIAPGRGGTGPVPFVEVETNTVDNILGKKRVTLMKIDVEGAEFLVLRGAERALEEGRINNLMIELHGAEGKDRLDSLLASHHYRMNWLDDTPGSGISRVLATLDTLS